MTKKKKLIIGAIAAVSVLFIVFAGAFIWYINSPFATVTNLAKAAASKDFDGILDFIEPDTADRMRRLIAYFDIDANALMDRLMPDNETLALNSGNSEVKLSSYRRDGDKAYIEISISDKKNLLADTRKIDFIRIDKKWYLTFSFGR